MRPDPREAEQFLEQHPEIRGIDLLLTDPSGVLRGKRIRRHEMERLYQEGRPLPSSIMSLTITGEDAPDSGLVWEVGDADCLTRPVAGSLRVVPWAEVPTAQLLLSMDPVDGQPAAQADPRLVLAQVIAGLHADGYYPVMASELEFYLLDRQLGPDGKPQAAAAPRDGYRSPFTEVYAVDELAGFAPFIEALYEACEVQGLPAETAISEFAPGQFEITLRHRDDALQAMDEGILYKRAVKGVAARFGLQACFMAKPFAQLTGSGLHLHVSLADAQGNNLFASPDPEGSPLLKQAIGGLMHSMAECMAIFAPNANSYRRFRANSYAPLTPCWGVTNRSVSLRVPAGPAASRHIEHRVCGADANLYLAAAAVLAGIHQGLRQPCDPGPAVSGDGYRESHAQPLPLNWYAALEAFERSAFVSEYLGEGFKRVFLAIKREELSRFFAEVTELDYAWYMRHA